MDVNLRSMSTAVCLMNLAGIGSVLKRKGVVIRRSNHHKLQRQAGLSEFSKGPYPEDDVQHTNPQR